MANESRGTILKFISGNALPVAVVLTVFLVIVPIPKFLIDLSMILNLAFSIIILLQVIRIPRPSDFQSFPRIVLLQTLFSLGINISSTRLILTGKMQGGALQNQSDMVKAFSRIVAGNNLVVGFVIFIVVIVVQVLVVTKGAGRVSEVQARFSLDSMNQKMFDIDNRLNSGAINEEQAEVLKAAIRRDIDFYSNMDGSSKFVSGNVKAGIFITVINLLGGFLIGMIQNNMGFTEALNTYSTLTIGDGLTSQLPSLIIAFATGLLITGTKGDETLDQQLKTEFAGDGHVYEIVGGVLIVSGLVLRGGTQYLLLPVGALAIYIGWAMTRDKQKKEIAQQQANAQKASSKASAANDSESIVMLDPLSLELGYALIPLVDQEKGAELLERISRIRVEARHDIGLDIPKIHIQDNMTLEPNDYSFKIAGIEAGHSAVRVGYVMCLDTGTVTEPLDGEKTKDPAFGMDAIWLPEDRRSEAEASGYVIVDPPTIISTHITEIIRAHAADLLDRQAVSVILDTVKQKNPVLVSEVLDTAKISYGTIEKVLQNLLEERVSIRNYVKILETMANYASVSRNVWDLTQKVREALGLQICMQYADDNKKIHVMRLSQKLSELIADHAVYPEDGSKPYVGFDPVDRRRWVQAVSSSLAKVTQLGYQPVIITVSNVRQLVRSSLEREMPGIAVISDMEMYAAGSSISPEIIDEIADEENE